MSSTFSKIPSIKTLTIVKFDLCKSSLHTRDIDRKGGAALVNSFLNQIITEFVQPSFPLNRSEYNNYQQLEGDACRLFFEDPNNAYQFTEKFCQLIEKRNKKPNKDPLNFRIGAVTGEVYFDPARTDDNKIVGTVLTTLSRLVTADPPGYFYVDIATFESFTEDVKQKFQSTKVKGKEHDNKNNNNNNIFPAYRCQMFRDIDEREKETEAKELKGEQKKQFREAIKSAFPDLKELRLLLNDNSLGYYMDKINTTEGYIYVLDYLITQVESDGNTSTFLDILLKAKPNNLILKKIYDQYNN